MSTVKLNEELMKLKSSEIGERKNAAWILGDLGDKRAVDPLIVTLRNEPDRFVRINIVKALAKIGDKKALSILSTLKDKDSDSKVRKEASWAYFKIKEGPEKTSTKISKTVMKMQPKSSLIKKPTSKPGSKVTSLSSSSSRNLVKDNKQLIGKPISKPVKRDSRITSTKVSKDKKFISHSITKEQKVIPKLPSSSTSKSIPKSTSSSFHSSQKKGTPKSSVKVSTTKTIVKMKPVAVKKSQDSKVSQKPKPIFKKKR